MAQVYTGALVIVDVLLMLLKILYCIGEAIYKLFVPTKEKDVTGEIVLVSSKNSCIDLYRKNVCIRKIFL